MKSKGYQSRPPNYHHVSKSPPVLPSVKIQPAVQYEDRFKSLFGEDTMIKIEREMAPVSGHCSICFSNETIEADPLKKCSNCSTVVCDVCTVWTKTEKRVYPSPLPRPKSKKKVFQVDHNALCPTCGWKLYDYLVYHFRKEIW